MSANTDRRELDGLRRLWVARAIECRAMAEALRIESCAQGLRQKQREELTRASAGQSSLARAYDDDIAVHDREHERIDAADVARVVELIAASSVPASLDLVQRGGAMVVYAVIWSSGRRAYHVGRTDAGDQGVYRYLSPRQQIAECVEVLGLIAEHVPAGEGR